MNYMDVNKDKERDLVPSTGFLEPVFLESSDPLSHSGVEIFFILSF